MKRENIINRNLPQIHQTHQSLHLHRNLPLIHQSHLHHLNHLIHHLHRNHLQTHQNHLHHLNHLRHRNHLHHLNHHRKIRVLVLLSLVILDRLSLVRLSSVRLSLVRLSLVRPSFQQRELHLLLLLEQPSICRGLLFQRNQRRESSFFLIVQEMVMKCSFAFLFSFAKSTLTGRPIALAFGAASFLA